MAGWVCPECRRLFARAHQSHECFAAMTLDEYLATGPPFERPVFEAVMAALGPVGDVVVEPVSVGLFLKRPDGFKFVELRPLTKWMSLAMGLGRLVDDRRISRKPIRAGDRVWHWVNLHSPDDVDETVADWLAEAYGL